MTEKYQEKRARYASRMQVMLVSLRGQWGFCAALLGAFMMSCSGQPSSASRSDLADKPAASANRTQDRWDTVIAAQGVADEWDRLGSVWITEMVPAPEPDTVYVVGMFDGLVAFPVRGEQQTLEAGAPPYSDRNWDVYIGRFNTRRGYYDWLIHPVGRDADGNMLQGSHAEAIRIAADTSGVYVSGDFGGTIQLGEHALTADGRRQTFLAKMDSSGEVLWAQMVTPTSGRYLKRLEVDGRGHLYMVRWDVLGRVDNGIDVTSFSVIKIKAEDGTNIWTATPLATVDETFPSRTELRISDVAIDRLGNVVVSGMYRASAVMPFATFSLPETADLDFHGFVTKVSGDLGAFEWVHPTSASLGEVAVHPETQEVYLAAASSTTVAFGDQTIPPGGHVARLSTNGQVLPTVELFTAPEGTSNRRFPGYVRRMTFDQHRNLAIAGLFSGSIDLGGLEPVESRGSYDYYWAQLDLQSGNMTYGQTAGTENYDYSLYEMQALRSSTLMAFGCGGTLGLGDKSVDCLTDYKDHEIVLWRFDAPPPADVLPEIESWYADGRWDNSISRIDVQWPERNHPRNPSWAQVHVYDLLETDLGRLADYHVGYWPEYEQGPDWGWGVTYFGGNDTWPHTYYRYHGSALEFRKRGLPRYVQVRFLDDSGAPQSQFSKHPIDLGTMP